MQASDEVLECRAELRNTEDRLRQAHSIVLKKDEEIRSEREVAEEIYSARKGVEVNDL